MESRSISTSDLAHLLATTPKTIAAYANQGVVARLGRGRYNEVESVRGFAKHARSTRTSSGDTATASVAAERAALLRAQRERAELTLERASGRLMDIDEVNAYVTKILVDERQRVLALANIMTHRASLSQEQSAVVEDEIRAFLTDMANAKVEPPTEREVAAAMAIRQRKGWVRKDWTT